MNEDIILRRHCCSARVGAEGHSVRCLNGAGSTQASESVFSFHRFHTEASIERPMQDNVKYLLNHGYLDVIIYLDT